jgi:hypothetical protein
MDIVGDPVDVERSDECFRDAGDAIGHDGYVRHSTLLVLNEFRNPERRLRKAPFRVSLLNQAD